MNVSGYKPLGAVPTPVLPAPQPPVNHDGHYDPGHGTPPPRLDTGVDPQPPVNHGPNCGIFPKPVYQ
jgi:hypothetical protein